jgi:hypothetical protein
MTDTRSRTTFLLVAAGAVLASLLVAPVPANADFVATEHSEYQAVNADGTSAWPSGGGAPYDISMTGVVINNPWDMLDYDNAAAWPQWQVYVQATAPDDFGGTALYMRKLTPWSGQNYTDSEWTAEMERLNYPLGTSEPPLQRGDSILVEARAPGLFYNGKYNVNEQHMVAPEYDFDITILDRGLTPEASSIALSDLKDSGDNFIFDQTRATGCEFYQASLVHLDGLLLDDAASWALDGTVTVRQGELTFPMKLGIDPALSSIDANLLASTPFSVTAILDQEDDSSPYTGSYRLWLTNANDLNTVPEPGALAILLSGGLCAMMLRLRARRRKQ